MNHISKWSTLGALMVVPSILGAQQLTGRDKWADSARVLIESAVQRGDVSSIDSARILLERALTAFPNDPLLLHYQGYAFYRKATLAMGRDKNADTGPFLDAARSALEKASLKQALPETLALQSAVYGQLIGRTRNPVTIMSLGSKSSDAMAGAVSSGAKNPRVWLLRGIGAIFTPSLWGGGLDKAEGYLKHSLSYYRDDAPARPLPAWGYGEAYIWLGQVYEKQGKVDAARVAYENAIKVEPSNGWARVLLAGANAKVSSR